MDNDEVSTLIEGQEAVSTQEKAFALTCHLAPLAGYFLVIGHILVPLVILIWKGGSSKFIDYHARESLNFQISVTIYWIITIALMFLLVGFLVAIPLILLQFVVMIIASAKAGRGELYRYPLCFKFIK